MGIRRLKRFIKLKLMVCLCRRFGFPLPLDLIDVDGHLPVRDKYLLRLYARQVPSRTPTIVEVGTFCGLSMTVLGTANWRARIYCVDPFTGLQDGTSQTHYAACAENGDLSGTVLRTASRYGIRSRITLLKGTSKEVFEQGKVPKQVHLLFIDGSHDYEDVKYDFEHYAPLVVEGGVAIFHDVVSRRHDGPRRVAEEVRGYTGWKEEPVWGCCTVFRKVLRECPE
jgi:predicted O-methyltransferase YrrM